MLIKNHLEVKRRARGLSSRVRGVARRAASLDGSSGRPKMPPLLGSCASRACHRRLALKHARRPENGIPSDGVIFKDCLLILNSSLPSRRVRQGRPLRFIKEGTDRWKREPQGFPLQSSSRMSLRPPSFALASRNSLSERTPCARDDGLMSAEDAI